MHVQQTASALSNVFKNKFMIRTSQFCLSRTAIMDTDVLIPAGFPKLYLLPENTYGTLLPRAKVSI